MKWQTDIKRCFGTNKKFFFIVQLLKLRKIPSKKLVKQIGLMNSLNHFFKEPQLQFIYQQQ